MGLQFSRAVEDTEIWSAIGDGFSLVAAFVVSCCDRFWCETGAATQTLSPRASSCPSNCFREVAQVSTRQAHNLKVTGSNPVPATKLKPARSIT